MIVSAAWLGTPASQSRIGGTIRPSSNTLVACEGIEPGHGAADVVVVAERLHERDDLRRSLEHRHRHAQVGQVPDAALGAVDVVVEEHVALAHLLEREVAGDRVHQRGVGAAGQLAQQPVVDAGPEVVRVADHRAAAGPADRGLDLHLDAGQRALDDLDQHRVGARPGVGGEVAERELGRRPACVSAHDSLLRHDQVEVLVDPDLEARVDRHRGAELLDDRRPGRRVARAQVGSLEHRRVDVPVLGARSRPPRLADPSGSSLHGVSDRVRAGSRAAGSGRCRRPGG